MKLLTKFKGIILQQSLILLIPSVWTVEDYISVEISFEIDQDITTQIREKNNTGHFCVFLCYINIDKIGHNLNENYSKWTIRCTSQGDLNGYLALRSKVEYRVIPYKRMLLKMKQ